MGRLLVTLSAVCLAVTLAIIWQYDPVPFYRSFNKEAENPQPASDSTSKKPNTPNATSGKNKPNATSGKNKTTAGSSKAPGITDETSIVPGVAIAQPQAGHDTFQATVKRDGAAVYAINASDSAILRLLRRGDRVEINLEVIDTEGKWVLIKGVRENTSGYVRSQELETTRRTRLSN